MPKVADLEITYRSIADLIPYARNARTHSEEQVGQIAASIREFGFTNPVLIDEEGGIIAGHGRVAAASKLKIEAVPTIMLAGLTEAQKRAYILADNRLPLNAGWDFDMLAVELDELRDQEFDLSMIGFSTQELNNLIGTPNVPPVQGGGTDANAEWQGMPEFDQQDKTAFQSLAVHFKSQEDVDAFALLVGQKITDKTRYLWFPMIEIETYADKRYAQGGGEEEHETGD